MKIKVTDVEKINAALEDVQNRCSARTVDAADVAKICERVEERLGISKRAMDGITVVADCHAQQFPSAYRYTPESTHVYLMYRRGAWYMTDARRESCWSPTVGVRVNLTDAAREAIVQRCVTFGM